jgi:NADPH:quinone reductase-like Zn-dependent oxidoreductase
MQPDGLALQEISHLVGAHRIRPIVDRIYALRDIAAAHAYCQSGQARGKIVPSLQ